MPLDRRRLPAPFVVRNKSDVLSLIVQLVLTFTSRFVFVARSAEDEHALNVRRA